MKIVIAPDSYKESLSAMDVATQIEAGFREIYPDSEYIKLPVADGGEGTVEAMVANQPQCDWSDRQTGDGSFWYDRQQA